MPKPFNWEWDFSVHKKKVAWRLKCGSTWEFLPLCLMGKQKCSLQKLVKAFLVIKGNIGSYILSFGELSLCISEGIC